MNIEKEQQIRAEIVALEAARCRALVEADLDTLERLVSDDVVHVHANGTADSKSAYIDMVRGQIRFLAAQRERLDVRVYDRVAIATGPLRQSIEMTATGLRVDMHIMTTQVWRNHAGSWRQVSFQATNL